MVWIRQLINQDVNVYLKAELSATSERDLFASGLLPTRTPEEVYRAIVLQRLPSFVGEDRIGTGPFMLAAAPVRFGWQNAMLTGPRALRPPAGGGGVHGPGPGLHPPAPLSLLPSAAR